jgi:hypothetical protein
MYFQLSFNETENSDELNACVERCKSGPQADPSLRGLELSSRPTRVWTRFAIRRTILKYHKKLIADRTKSDEENLLSLAALSSKLSQWSVLVALEEARKYSLQAQEKDDLNLMHTPEDVSQSPTTNKRESHLISSF